MLQSGVIYIQVIHNLLTLRCFRGVVSKYTNDSKSADHDFRVQFKSQFLASFNTYLHSVVSIHSMQALWTGELLQNILTALHMIAKTPFMSYLYNDLLYRSI